MKITVSALRALLEAKFTATYFSASDASKIVDVLLYAERAGKNTQGVLKIFGTEPMPQVKAKRPICIVKETPVSVLIDGGGGPAILACRMANAIAIEKCKRSGLAIAATHNTYASSGAIGFYAEEAASHDLIGIVFAGSPSAVAPFGSIDPLLGTNPLAAAFPTLTVPVVFDTATSAITWYGLVRAQALGEQLPESVAIDENGRATTDPAAAMNGAILPFDRGHKGSGIALLVEILTGPLAGGSFASTNGDWSSLIILIDPEILVGRRQFKNSCSELVERILKSRPSASTESITIPGWRNRATRDLAESHAELEIDDAIMAKLT
jgi:L-2-hydroxycarboxylate dehydrogenase (NAD+)